jgi:hypothetical protein
MVQRPHRRGNQRRCQREAGISNRCVWRSTPKNQITTIRVVNFLSGIWIVSFPFVDYCAGEECCHGFQRSKLPLPLW